VYSSAVWSILAEWCHKGERGGYDVAHSRVIVSAVAPSVKYITGYGPNIPWYSSWKTITVAFCPVQYSGSTKWIAADARAKLCRAGDSKYWDVVGWRPKLFTVKKNCPYINQVLPNWWTMNYNHRRPSRGLHCQPCAPYCWSKVQSRSPNPIGHYGPQLDMVNLATIVVKRQS